ncbi:hypothetical protein NN561_015051 [Cricetulus griseus]
MRPDSPEASARSPGADLRQELRARAAEDSDGRIQSPSTALRLSSVSIDSTNTQSALEKNPPENPEYPIEASGFVGPRGSGGTGRTFTRQESPGGAQTASTPKRRKQCACCATTALRTAGPLRVFIQTDCQSKEHGQRVEQSDTLAEWYPGNCSSVFLRLNTHGQKVRVGSPQLPSLVASLSPQTRLRFHSVLVSFLLQLKGERSLFQLLKRKLP